MESNQEEFSKEILNNIKLEIQVEEPEVLSYDHQTPHFTDYSTSYKQSLHSISTNSSNSTPFSQINESLLKREPEYIFDEEDILAHRIEKPSESLNVNQNELLEDSQNLKFIQRFDKVQRKHELQRINNFQKLNEQKLNVHKLKVQKLNNIQNLNNVQHDTKILDTVQKKKIKNHIELKQQMENARRMEYENTIQILSEEDILKKIKCEKKPELKRTIFKKDSSSLIEKAISNLTTKKCVIPASKRYVLVPIKLIRPKTTPAPSMPAQIPSVETTVHQVPTIAVHKVPTSNFLTTPNFLTSPKLVKLKPNTVAKRLCLKSLQNELKDPLIGKSCVDQNVSNEHFPKYTSKDVLRWISLDHSYIKEESTDKKDSKKMENVLNLEIKKEIDEDNENEKDPLAFENQSVNEKREDEGTAKINGGKRKILYKCNEEGCYFMATNENRFYYHTFRHIASKMEPCSQCGQIFDCPKEYFSHLKSHYINLTCLIKGKCTVNQFTELEMKTKEKVKRRISRKRKNIERIDYSINTQKKRGNRKPRKTKKKVEQKKQIASRLKKKLLKKERVSKKLKIVKEQKNLKAPNKLKILPTLDDSKIQKIIEKNPKTTRKSQKSQKTQKREKTQEIPKTQKHPKVEKVPKTQKSPKVEKVPKIQKNPTSQKKTITQKIRNIQKIPKTQINPKAQESPKPKKNLKSPKSKSPNKIIPPTEELYECYNCGERFKQKKRLTIHIYKHMGIKLYPCSICKKQFTQPGTVTLHMKTHSKDYEYKCAICEKTFLYKGNYMVHMRVHTKVRPFQCKQCLKTFTQSSSLKTHMLTHWKDIKEEEKLGMETTQIKK